IGINGDVSTRSVHDQRIIHRAATVKAFRRFLDTLDEEISCYNVSSNQNEFSNICFKYIRKAVRSLRDDQKSTQQIAVFTVLDLTTAWSEYINRQFAQRKMSRAKYTMHNTFCNSVRGMLNGWRLFWVQTQMPEESDVHETPPPGPTDEPMPRPHDAWVNAPDGDEPHKQEIERG